MVRGTDREMNTLAARGLEDFFPSCAVGQFLVLAGNRLWFYILMYLEFIQLFCCVSFLVLAGNSFWCSVRT
jgi:hypothetical protein